MNVWNIQSTLSFHKSAVYQYHPCASNFTAFKEWCTVLSTVYNQNFPCFKVWWVQNGTYLTSHQQRGLSEVSLSRRVVGRWGWEEAGGVRTGKRWNLLLPLSDTPHLREWSSFLVISWSSCLLLTSTSCLSPSSLMCSIFASLSCLASATGSSAVLSVRKFCSSTYCIYTFGKIMCYFPISAQHIPSHTKRSINA